MCYGCYLVNNLTFIFTIKLILLDTKYIFKKSPLNFLYKHVKGILCSNILHTLVNIIVLINTFACAKKPRVRSILVYTRGLCGYGLKQISGHIRCFNKHHMPDDGDRYLLKEY